MMLPAAMEGEIEETVDMDLNFPSVTERYWTKYYFIPKERRRPGSNGDGNTPRTGDGGSEGGKERVKGDASMEEEATKMEVEEQNGAEKKDNKSKESLVDERLSPQEKGEMKAGKPTYSSLDTSGHVCVMVHTNKLCLVTLSPKHPALAPGQEVTQVSYNVGKFNRLDNQVSGKGKRGAQMMGPQSPVCVITCADGSRHGVLAGVHGKLVEVNERLLTNPKLVRERPDAEGYLAVILPPIRNGDGPLKQLIPGTEYWAREAR